MKNQDTMHLRLSRSEVCDIRMLLLSVAADFEQEARNSEKARDNAAAQKAKNSSQKWYTLRSKIIGQFEAQD